MPTNRELFDLGTKYYWALRSPVLPVLTSANGCYIRDIEGKEYIDFTSGQISAGVGHQHPKVVEAIRDQSEKIMHNGNEFFSDVQIDLMLALSQTLPNKLSKVSFYNTGSEVNEVALKAAKIYTDNYEFVSPVHCYYGLTGGVGPLTTAGRSFGPQLTGAIHVPYPYCYKCSLNLEYPDCGIACLSVGEDIIGSVTTGRVAAFITELLLGSSGAVVAPKEWVEGFEKLCRDFGALLILDECQTGMGRTGKMYAFEHYDVVPDILTLGKSIGDGIPLSCVVVTDDMARKTDEVLLEGQIHGTSHMNDPLPCAVGLAVLRIIEEERLIENAEKMGKYLMERLRDLQERHDVIGDVRGKGLMIGVELVKDRKTKEPAVEETKKIHRTCLEKGLTVGTVIRPLQTCLRIMPPLIITEEIVDKAVEIIDSSIDRERI